MKRIDFIKNGVLSATGISLLSSFKFSEESPNLPRIKPPALKKNDKIAVISPAGAVWNNDRINDFVTILKSFGFDVVLGKSLENKFGYFSGTDEFRAKEINDLFKDKTIKGIFCMKGGWGCARLLDKLDYELIKSNPKVLIGFSDITSLLIAITNKTGLITFHGPVGNSGWNGFTSSSFKKVVMESAVFEFQNHDAAKNFEVLSKGKALGELVGGNLSVLCGFAGSEYFKDLKGKILFLEEFKEEPYSIDRMLTQLKLLNVFNEVSAVILGQFSKCVPEEPEKSFSLQEVFDQYFKNIDIPVISNVDIGHVENKHTIPIGCKATIDTEKGILKLREAAVS
ncbi:MAG: LD-carboxypeptidase [Bacteroidia bacterium]